MGHDLPQPVTVGDCYAAAILSALDTLNSTLGDIRDRLPPSGGGPAAAEEPIQEPRQAEPPDGALAIQEPAPRRTRQRTGKGR